MKTLQLSITTISGIVIISILSQAAFGSQPCPTGGYIHYGPSRQSIPCYLVTPQSNPTFEEQFGNPTKTKLVNDGSILVLNQTAQKLEYKMGENITIIPELINIGNRTISIAYLEPAFFLEIKNQTGDVVWPQSTRIGWVPEYSGIKTSLKPGEHFSGKPWGVTLRPDIFPPTIRLSDPGNYTVISIGLFTFNTTHSVTAGNLEPIWSKPLQITILPEKVPEFPFAVPILLISITSLIVFYRIRIRK